MGLFHRQKEPAATSVQIRNAQRHPFGMLDSYVPLGGGDIRLYRAIREAVPIVDAAILKTIRLIGGFRVECQDKTAEQQLADFLRTVNTGRGQRGIASFLDCYLDSLLICGRAVGEIVVSGNREISALLCGNVEDVQIREGSTPLEFELCSVERGGFAEPFPYQELLLFTPFYPEAEHPYGVSMLRSMPFLTDILLKIYNAIGVNWERVGNVRFAVVYKPQGDIVDRAYARERSAQIAKEWSYAMQSGKNGAVRDFVAVGDVEVKVIGADNQVPDSEVPVRQILEQIVARTGIPPFMLGLSWSTTERMSSQQAELLSSELAAIRRCLTPVLDKICGLWLRMHGYSCGFEVVWDPISLSDDLEEARAALYYAQAETISERREPEVEESESGRDRADRGDDAGSGAGGN